MGPFDLLLGRIALGERLRKAARWDYRAHFGLLLWFSLTIVFFTPWIRPLFSEAHSLRLWFLCTLYCLLTVAFVLFCAKYVPAIISVVAVATIWILYFSLG